MSPSPSLNQSAPEALTRELDADEQILWMGQPDPARLFRRALQQSLFGIAVLAFAVFWMWRESVLAHLAPTVTTSPKVGELCTLAILLFFVGMEGWRTSTLWRASWNARRAFYALTSKRVLIGVQGTKKSVQSVSPDEFVVRRHDLPKDKGDVVLKSKFKKRIGWTLAADVGFCISDVREVERIARDMEYAAR